jgi:predicted SnoaL-like aldol condensation-catalyzing enzyme
MTPPQPLTERNRAIVLDFVELFYRQRRVRDAFIKHVGDSYVQHNPHILDGREAAIAALAPKFSAPGAHFDVKRVLVDGDLAAVHLHARLSPEARGGAVVDLFRLADGKIVEHWDILQPVPERCANPHPMF